MSEAVTGGTHVDGEEEKNASGRKELDSQLSISQVKTRKTVSKE